LFETGAPVGSGRGVGVGGRVGIAVGVMSVICRTGVDVPGIGVAAIVAGSVVG
jgi:hypothetical protein